MENLLLLDFSTQTMKFVAVILLSLASLGTTNPAATKEASPGTKGKLLYILLDGFRYDYLDDQNDSDIPGFRWIIENGVKAKWMNPLTPSLSYPSWTSLSTGLYAENHTIVGNYMYDPVDQDDFSLFDDTLTGKKKWWVSEPIWTTATKAGYRAALYLWARCDVEYDGVLPEYCEKFQKITGPEIFRTNIEKAIAKFKEGFDLVQVYTEHLDNIGHTIGPETESRQQAVREIDETLVFLKESLEEEGLEDEVNIVIVSDHGMTNTAPETITRVELDDYLSQNASIERIADKGTFINIKVLDDSVDEVYTQLKAMPGVTIYKKDEIPEDFHVVGSPYMHDILIVAELGTFVMASNRIEQLPTRDDSFVYYGAHGYDKKEAEMRAIFFAKGPAFVPGTVLEPIEMVDVYQALTHALNIEGVPNNGTLAHIEAALAGADSVFSATILPMTLCSLLALLLK
ncbi:Type I phosphodiesterase/nucleotide pyrophosphatase/phosphate transferase [Trinorchestia longiramus]|nr:Type I phosphodiesterase/nucleotide pyrophosphatase/phosphate transferase [Trinorchestia longiramus]